VCVLACCSDAVFSAGPDDTKAAPKVYIPYKDVAAIIPKTDRAVLMDRAEFDKLLKAAKASAPGEEAPEVGQIARGDYTASVNGEKLNLKGGLVVESLSGEPVAVEIPFGRVGLTEILLDGKPAPVNYNNRGRLVLIVTGKGLHKLTLSGSAKLSELSGGGMQFSIVLPTAAAGAMKLELPGDQEAHANVPVSATSYDKQADRTTVGLTLGGHGTLSVALLGNGRQEDQRSILLGESATSVGLTPTGQTMNCLYTVQVLRRGVRELRFNLDRAWTITDVSCPSLVKWSVVTPDGKGPKELTVRLRSATRGTKALHIKASAPMPESAWRGPRVSLAGAGHQRGYVLIDPGEQLAVRAEKLQSARRQDVRGISAITGMAGSSGRLYFHWGNAWSVGLQLAQIELRKHNKERQIFTISPNDLVLNVASEITAVGREMFTLDFVLPGESSGWDLTGVTVNGSKKGFEYRTVAAGETQTLRIELARPVAPEAAAKVNLLLRRVPADWDWSSKIGSDKEAVVRKADFPLVRCLADKSSGLAAVAVIGDLDADVSSAAGMLKLVTVGKMTSLGLGRNVRAAYTYETSPTGALSASVSRPEPRIAANAVGLASVSPGGVKGRFTLVYGVTRVGTRTLYLLADKSLGRKLKIETPGRQLASRGIVAPGPDSLELPKAVSGAYNLWQLKLDSQARGRLGVSVRYELPLPEGEFALPLVRPAGAERATEALAIEATEELAVTVSASQAREVDTMDIPPLPAKARRVLGAFRLADNPRVAGPLAEIRLGTAVHKNYAIPSALVTEAELRTTVGADGSQQTQAQLRVVNAGLQFLTIKLPKNSRLLSVRIGDKQAKLKRDAAGGYQVSLPQARVPITVTLVYATPPNGAGPGNLQLTPVELPGLHINTARWRVIPPSGFHITSHDSDMSPDRTLEMPRTVPAAVQVLEAGTLSDGKDMWVGASSESRATFKGTPGVDKEVDARIVTGEGPPDSNFQAERNSPPPTTRPAAKPHDATKERFETTTLVEGRYTLPVRLVESRASGPEVVFSGLGSPRLTISMTAAPVSEAQEWIGLALAGLIGVCLLKATVMRKFLFVVIVGLAATLVAIWMPSFAHGANGCFYAACLLVVLYVAVGLCRMIANLVRGGKSPAVAHTAALLLVTAAILAAVSPTYAAPPASSPKGKPAAVVRKAAPVVVPYDGDPSKAAAANKVLLPYRRFVRLWNRAHPDQKIELSAIGVTPRAKVSLAGVSYTAVVADKKMNVTLQADVTARGKGLAVIPMPISGMAITKATLGDKPARFQVGPKGMVLVLDAPFAGKFVLNAVTTPKYTGRKGSVDLSLPPLPLAVMKVQLPDADLELDAGGIDAVLTRQDAGQGVVWTVPLGSQRKVALRWSPKAGTGAADRTLSATATHDIGVFHWALNGISKLAYSFSAGQNDRFEILVPEGVSITKIDAANLRDYRVAGSKVIEGRKFSIVDVRLHRPASKRYGLSVRWIGDLPALGEPARLWLPRAGRVGREAGYVNLYTAGGMVLKVTDVRGGRRRDIAPAAARSPKKAAAIPLLADSTVMAASYHWPYRDFAMFVQLSRRQAEAKVKLDQLVRVSPDRVQLLVRASLRAAAGGGGRSRKLFGGAFNLPGGYELLSVVGPDVEDWHVQKPADAKSPRRLHVNFRTAVAKTNVAIVLVQDEAKIDRLAVPTIVAVDADGRVIADQGGRLAVQVAIALDAHTASSKLLKPITPSATSGWLDRGEAKAVQFAYSFEKPGIALELAVRKHPTKVRVEILGGVSILHESAEYTYRLRYNISGSPVDRVSFTLPSKYAQLVAVSSPSLRSVNQSDGPAGRRKWTVALTNEVTGVLDISVNFALPIDASTSQLPVPRIVTDAPDGYRAIVAVQNLSRHELAFVASETMTPLAVAVQRNLLSQAVSKSLQYVYQSFKDDWSASLKVTPAKAASRIQAIVDLMALVTVIDKSGQCRYEAKLSLHNRSEQFLKIKLPAGLQLWSARVAGQAVKPVLPSGVSGTGAGGGVVHVPLVKTSRGGLPYDVTLYLAGKGTERISGITRISPPSVRIVGIPVKQTTWSLRLPRGFRYIRPEGNMSPIAGTAERLSIGIEARSTQLQRYSKAHKSSYNNPAQEQVFQRNWKILNEFQSRDIQKARDYLDNNRDAIGENLYQRITNKMDKASAGQYGLVKNWTKSNTGSQAAAERGVNYWINAASNNPGTSEVDRNSGLATIPNFVQQAGKDQLKNIQSEFAVNVEELEFRRKGEKSTRRGKPGKGKPTSGREGGKFFTYDEDKDGELDKVTEALAGEQERLLVMRQDRLKKQVRDLGDNRLQRYYTHLNAPGQRQPQVGGHGMGQGEGQGQGQATIVVPQFTEASSDAKLSNLTTNLQSIRAQLELYRLHHNGMYPTDLTNQLTRKTDQDGTLNPAGAYGPYLQQFPANPFIDDPVLAVATTGAAGEGWAYVAASGSFTANSPPNVRGGITISGGTLTTANGTLTIANGGWTDIVGAGSGRPARGDRRDTGGQAEGEIAAGGTFSLPVELPTDGGEVLDFAYPGGDPEVSVLAVPVDVWQAGRSTIGILIALLVLAAMAVLARKLVARSRRASPDSAAVEQAG